MSVFRLIFIICVLLIVVSLAVVPGLAQEPPPQPLLPAVSTAYAPGEIVVKFRPHVGMLGAQGSLRAEGLSPLEVSSRGELLRVQVEPGREAEAIAELMARGDVEFATYNYLIEALGDPNDPNYSLQWALKQIQDHDIDAPEAWDIYTGGNSVTIAVLDTGVDLDHPDLQANIVAGYDYVNGDNNPDDDHGHGTHVAGIAAAIGNNSTGIAGVSWASKIMPVKVLNSAGSGSTYNLSQGIYYAVDHGAKIINMSVGAKYAKWPCNWSDVEAAFNYAVSHGVLMAVAAGNDYQYGVNCPAAYDQVMAVGSTTSSDTRSSFSNYGPRLDIAAPGSSIYSTVRFGGYGYKDGTSMATPHVAGLAALLWSFAPSLTHSQVRDLIQNNADDLGAAGWDQYFGYGRINAYNTLDSINLQATSPVVAMIDDDGDLVTGTIEISSMNPNVISWTAEISPTVAWLEFSSATSGTISASSSPVWVTLVGTTSTITYGTHTTTVVITGTMASGTDTIKTSEARLIYSHEIFQYYFPIMFKDEAY
jgi:thermitase